VAYLENYATHFDLHRRIQVNCKVVNIKRQPSGKHEVTFVRRCSMGGPTEWERGDFNHCDTCTMAPNFATTDPETIAADFVALCAGLHVTPSIPSIPGIEYILEQRNVSMPPTVFHSVDYKKRSQLSGRRVMILGSGETGMDLAYESVKAGASEVILCSRSG